MAPRSRYAAGLAEGRTVYGVFCCLDGFAVSHILAAAGFDFVVFDRQHAAYSWPELEQMSFRVRSEGTAVFLRTASAEESELNLALDLPVDGIVIPNTASLEQARTALAMTRFPPAGVRSLGNERHEALRGAAGRPEPLVGMLIEHPGAVEAIDGILALGVDFVWVGTHDLAALMGLEPQDAVGGGRLAPELAAAERRVKGAARARGVPYWEPPGPDAQVAIADVDARMVRRAAEDALARLRA